MYDWQTITAIFIAGTAVAVLSARIVAYFRGKRTSCGGCSACPKSTTTSPVQTTFAMPTRPEKRDAKDGLSN